MVVIKETDFGEKYFRAVTKQAQLKSSVKLQVCNFCEGQLKNKQTEAELGQAQPQLGFLGLISFLIKIKNCKIAPKLR